MNRFVVGPLLSGALTTLLCATAWAEPWKFAAMSDVRQGAPDEKGCTNGVHYEVVHALATDAARQGVKLVVFPGDLASGSSRYGPLRTQWQAWKEAMKPLYEAGIAVYPVRGNHEVHPLKAGGGIKEWQSFFAELPDNGPAGQKKLTYEVRVNNASFIGFDQYVQRRRSFNAKEYSSAINHGMVPGWVIGRIKASKSQWVFAFAHEPGFIAHHLDCLANDPAGRDQLWDALGAKHGVFLCGHDHMYVRREEPDRANRRVLELIVGDGGAPPYVYDHAGLNADYDRHVVPTDLFINASQAKAPKPNTGGHPMYFGYLVITVDGSKLEGQWRAFTNFDVVKNAGPVPPEEPKFEALDTFTWEQ